MWVGVDLSLPSVHNAAAESSAYGATRKKDLELEAGS